MKRRRGRTCGHIWQSVFLVAGMIIVVCILLVQMCSGLLLRARMNALSVDVFADEDFREMNISPQNFQKLVARSEETSISVGALMASVMVDRQYQLLHTVSVLDDSAEMARRYEEKKRLNEEALMQLTEAYAAVWEDLKYFPVPQSSVTPNALVYYENSWMSERTYGGERGHEGTDLMASINQRDLYPVVSMTDGVVEKVGWLEQGGYRIGVRSPHGGYFYYAHLSSYAKQWKEGDPVKAGELLGMMGDTGYSKIVGTVGNFDVHLHLGIYIKTPQTEELSVNPYYILQSLENSKLTYAF